MENTGPITGKNNIINKNQKFLEDGNLPESPYCDNWLEIKTAIIDGQIAPKPINPKFKYGYFQYGNSCASSESRSQRPKSQMIKSNDQQDLVRGSEIDLNGVINPVGMGNNRQQISK